METDCTIPEILLLTAPPQHAADNPAVERDPKRLRQWLDSLRASDIDETVAALQARIAPFNELQMPDRERFELLEILQDACEAILYCYDELRLRSLPISPERRAMLAEDIVWIHLGLANGYKIIVRKGHAEGLQPGRDPILRLSIYRAMALLGEALLRAYRAHAPAPPLTYLELHQLYRFAEAGGVLDARLRVKGGGTHVTIAALYKQLLLLAALDPYRFEPGELAELQLLLEPFAGHCVIGPPRSETGRAFGLDLLNDAPPFPPGRDGGKGAVRCLDVAPASQACRRWLDAHGAQAPREAQLLVRALERLEPDTPEARAPRQMMHGQVAVAIGLSAVCDLLGDPGPRPSRPPGRQAAPPGTSAWRLLDTNEGGWLLGGGTEPAGRAVRIGEILGVVMASHSDGPRLGAGLVRWRRVGAGGEVRLGVERLPGNPLPITYRAADTDLPQPGIFFSRSEERPSPPLLLTRRKLYRPGCVLHVSAGPRVFAAEALAEVLPGPLFATFRFRARR